MRPARLVPFALLAMLLAALLALPHGAIAQSPPDAESLREQALAQQAEANPQAVQPFAVGAPVGVGEPLFGGVDDATLPTNGYSTTPPGPTWTPLFGGLEVWGAAYNHDSGQLYITNGTQLWRYDPVVGGAPTLVGSIIGAGGTAISMVGLAYCDGVAYGVRSISSSADPEGLYTVNLATAAATVVAPFSNPSGTDVGGLDCDATTGILYGTNDGSGLRGLVTVDKTTAALSLVTPYPAGETDIDGLAVGGGKAYLIEDDAGTSGGLVHVYNLSTNSYETGFPTPWTTSETFSGGAWMEEVAAPGGACSTDPSLEAFYFSDFEANDGGWVESGFGDWEWGAPVTGVYQNCDTAPRPEPSGAHSGSNVWATNLDGCYTNSNANSIISQTFDFSGRSGPIFLNWWHWYEVFESFDYAIVRVNGTQLWRTPNATATPNYLQQTVDLSAYAGQANVTIEFLLHASSVVNRMGWYVDDVELCGQGAAGPTPTPTATASATATATLIPSATATATLIPSVTATATMIPSATATTAATVTVTPPPTSIELGGLEGGASAPYAGWLLGAAGVTLLALGLVARRRR